MNYLKEIFTIFISSVMGASVSAIITILAGRRITNPLYNIFYSIKIYGLIFGISILILIIIFLKSKSKD